MTICHSLPADFCLRAVRAQASSDRQTSPVRASPERPANGRNSLIEKMSAALRSARLRFFPCFSGESRGETDALAPLFAASVRVVSATRIPPLRLPFSSVARDRIGTKLMATRHRSGQQRRLTFVNRRISWCERRESNPHSLFGKRILSPLRLPVSPRSQGFQSPAQGRSSPLISCAWRSTGKAIAPARSAPRRRTPSI
jgi:hypothetical protein